MTARRSRLFVEKSERSRILAWDRSFMPVTDKGQVVDG
jgi:hypothetical protein